MPSQVNEPQSANPAELYEEYLVPGIHARWTPVFLDYANPQPGEQVLDVACGTGIVARNVAPRIGADGTVIGFDVSPDMLAVARTLPEPAGAAIEWREGDATVSLPDGAFDLVLCQQALQFFADRAAAVREMRRVLASDGRAVVSVWQGLPRHPLYEALTEAEARYLGMPIEDLATPFTLGDANELRALLQEAGFQQVESAPESHPVQFPSPERFVTLTLLAAASIIPETEMDAEARSEMVKTISREVNPILQGYIQEDTVAFPMHAHIAVAQA